MNRIEADTRRAEAQARGEWNAEWVARGRLRAFRRERRRLAALGAPLTAAPNWVKKMEKEERRKRNERRRARFMRPEPVPADRVPRIVRVAAERMLRHVRAELGLPPTLRLQWFRPRKGVAPEYGSPASSGGLFRPGEPDRLWIRVRRSHAWEAAHIVAHEARHAWQHRAGWETGDVRMEPDASDYAETKILAFECERKAQSKSEGPSACR